MNLNFSNTAIRYIMFAFNFIFVITGIILISVGATVSSKYSSFEDVLDTKYFSLPNLLIATGVIIFFISFFGCYGAMRENWFFLMIFSVLLGIIFIFEFSAGIAGYVLRDKTSSYLESEFQRTMGLYSKSRPVQIMWDTIQRDYECCGINGKEDWYSAFKNQSLPLSCCPTAAGVVGVFYCNAAPNSTPAPTPATNDTNSTSVEPAPTDHVTTVTSTPTSATTASLVTTASDTEATTTHKAPNPSPHERKRRALQVGADPATPTSTTASAPTTYHESSSSPYGTGCETAFGDWVKAHAVDIGGVGFALAIIQLFGVGFSFHLARLLKNGNYSST